jgi:FtsH-binding integral membrane protein
MEPALVTFAILITVICAGIMVVRSFLAFGQAQRHSDAQLALGSYGVMLGLLFALVFLFPQARQTDFPYSDYYANNWIASGLFLWSGGVLLLGGLTNVGLRVRTGLLLIGAHSILLGLVVTFILPWKWPEFSLPAVALDVGVLLALEITLARHQQQTWVAGRAIVLAVGGVLVIALVSAFFGSYYLDGLGRHTGPPYIDGPVTLVSLGLGLLIFLVARAWRTSRRVRSP